MYHSVSMSWVFSSYPDTGHLFSVSATHFFFFFKLKKNVKTLTHLHGDLANGPGSIVTHGDKLWVQVEPQDWHKLSWGKGHGHAIKSLAHTQAL